MQIGTVLRNLTQVRRLRNALRHSGILELIDRYGLEQVVRNMCGSDPSQRRRFIGDLLLHTPLHKGYPKTEVLISEISAHDTPAIADRVRRAYSAARSSNVRTEQAGIWKRITEEFGCDFVRALESDSNRDLTQMIPDLLRSRHVLGFGAGNADFAALSDLVESKHYGTIFVDSLVALAEALGELTIECPEQGNWGANLYRDIAELARMCEQRIGCNLDSPPVCGAVGIDISGKLWMQRTPQHAYAIQRCCEISKHRKHASVAEIGAGYGGTGLIAARLGLDYTAYDLPNIAAIQGIYLLCALGQRRVQLFGEARTAEHKIALMPYAEFLREDADCSYDVVLNQDSLPEMPEATATAYTRAIPNRTRCFLSINQEAQADAWGTGGRQLVVSDLFESNATMVRVSRHPYWLRRGYVEELYETRV